MEFTLIAIYSTDKVIPPSFTRKLKDTNAILGAAIQMECRVSGSPPLSVSWFLDGEEIVEGAKHHLTFTDNTCALKVDTLELSDAGKYRCSAKNTAGADECSASLTVKGQ